MKGGIPPERNALFYLISRPTDVHFELKMDMACRVPKTILCRFLKFHHLFPHLINHGLSSQILADNPAIRSN